MQEVLELEAEIIQLLSKELMTVTQPLGPRALLYAEPTDKLVQSSIFVGDDNGMTVLTPSNEINLMVRDLWRVRRNAVPDQAWAAVVLELAGADFGVNYLLPSELQLGRDANERCKATYLSVYGNVPLRKP